MSNQLYLQILKYAKFRLFIKMIKAVAFQLQNFKEKNALKTQAKA